MAQLTTFPNLADRAARLLAEAGCMPDASLATALFGGTSAAWLRLLEQVLSEDRRFERIDGTWRLRCPDSESEIGGPAVAIAVIASGPQPFRHVPLAVAAVRFGQGRRAEWISLFRPERRVRLPSYLAQQGIDADALEHAPTFSAIAPGLLEFLDNHPLVGLDIATSVAYLQFALRRAGLPELGNPIVELAGQAERLESGRKRPDLGRLARRFGVPLPARRDARSIAVAVAEIAERARAGAVPDTPRFAKRAHRATANRPLHDLRTLETIPERPGVYRFLAADGEVLYIGKATNLQSRIASYISSDLHRTRQMAGLADLTARIEVAPVRTGLEAALVELREIRTLAPRYNVQQQEGDPLAFVCADLTKAAEWRTPKLHVQSLPEATSCGPLPRSAARRIVSLCRARHAWPAGRKRQPTVAMQRQAVAQQLWQEIAATVGRTVLPGGLTPEDVHWCAICTRSFFGQPIAVLVGVSGYAGSVELDEPDDFARELERVRTASTRQVDAGTLAELRLALRLAARSGMAIVPWRGEPNRFAAEVLSRLEHLFLAEAYEA